MPNITEAKLFEAFGLSPSQDQGEQVQEPAAPAAEVQPTETVEGERVQEIADPATVEVTQPEVSTDGAAQQNGQGTKQVETGKPPLSEEERRANAARRRQQEQQQAIDAAVAAEQAKQSAVLADIFSKAGLKNTFTGEPITTLEQFQAWNQQFADNQLQMDLKSGKLTVDGIHQVVEKHPAIQQAQELLEQQKRQQKAQQEAAEKARIDGELAEIAKLDPSIKGVADLLNMPTAAQFKDYVSKGYSFIDAFKLSNMERITAAKTEAVKQEAMNNARGKDHLRASGNARGSGAASVPPGQMEMFRRMNPGKSDAEILKFYNKYISRQGG